MRARLTLLLAVIAFVVPIPGHAYGPERTIVYENSNRFCDLPACTSADHSDVTILAGASVTFVFDDPICLALAAVGCYHNVKSSTGAFATTERQPIPGGPAIDLTFATTGDYNYICELHGSPMSGTVHVI